MAGDLRPLLLRGGCGTAVPASNCDADAPARGNAAPNADAGPDLDPDTYADVDAAFARLLAYADKDPYPDVESDIDAALVPDAGPLDALPGGFQLRPAEPVMHAADSQRPGARRRDRHDWPVELSSYQTAPRLAPDEGNGDRQAGTPRRGSFSRVRER